MIIGITGLLVDSEGNRRVAGAGKDSVADMLYVRRHVVKVALADPLKRICQDVYGFTYEQLWGPSQLRNEPDPRYIRLPEGSLGWIGKELNPVKDVYLTPRHALQQLGTEWARKCYGDTWINYGIRVANQLMNDQSGKVYIDRLGVVDPESVRFGVDTEDELEELEEEIGEYPEEVEHVAFSDVRFFNEVEAIRATGGKVVRVKRELPGVFVKNLDDQHLSEREVALSDDDSFDYIIDNSSSFDALLHNTLRMFDVLTGKIRPYDDAQRDVPPFMRKGP